MTDLEIDRALALKIGWKAKDLHQDVGGIYVKLPYCCTYVKRYFSHMDWNVIGPIGERFDCFPMFLHSAFDEPYWVADCSTADTPQAAIALAVIHGGMK